MKCFTFPGVNERSIVTSKFPTGNQLRITIEKQVRKIIPQSLILTLSVKSFKIKIHKIL